MCNGWKVDVDGSLRPEALVLGAMSMFFVFAVIHNFNERGGERPPLGVVTETKASYSRIFVAEIETKQAVDRLDGTMGDPSLRVLCLTSKKTRRCGLAHTDLRAVRTGQTPLAVSHLKNSGFLRYRALFGPA